MPQINFAVMDSVVGYIFFYWVSEFGMWLLDEMDDNLFNFSLGSLL